MRLALSIGAMIATVVFVGSTVNLFIVLRDPPPRSVVYLTPAVAWVAALVFYVTLIVAG